MKVLKVDSCLLGDILEQHVRVIIGQIASWPGPVFGSYSVRTQQYPYNCTATNCAKSKTARFVSQVEALSCRFFRLLSSRCEERAERCKRLTFEVRNRIRSHDLILRRCC